MFDRLTHPVFVTLTLPNLVTINRKDSVRMSGRSFGSIAGFEGEFIVLKPPITALNGRGIFTFTFWPMPMNRCLGEKKKSMFSESGCNCLRSASFRLNSIG